MATPLAAAVTAFHVAKLAGLVANCAMFPTLRPAPAAPGRPAISVLVPARDEARRIPATLRGLLAQPAAEILVLDDQSVDGTAAAVQRAAAGDPRLRLLPGAPLPAGWTGKNWACQQLAAAARGDVLVYCDADVRLAPGALDAFWAQMCAQDADLLSVFPRQRTGSAGERLLVPLIDEVLLAFLPHALLRSPVAAAATANGQLLGFRRGAYESVGGHAAVAGELVEDLALARRARRMGLTLGLALGGDLVSARMYHGYRESARGFGKSLRSAHGHHDLALAATAAWHLLAYTVPWLRWRRDRAWLAAAVLGLAQRLVVNVKTGRGAFAEAALVPVTPVAALAAYAPAFRRTACWKGRRYPVPARPGGRRRPRQAPPSPAGPAERGCPRQAPLSAAVPEPPRLPALGHLGHWAVAPLQLLEAGARAGPVFRLRLWRPALVGYRPEWNRAVLSDPGTFRSQGSLSGLTPYLSAGVVHADVPEHRLLRRALSPHFSARALAPLGDRLHALAEDQRPRGGFEAVAWSSRIVQRMLNVALFGDALPAGLLARFLRPLERSMPGPLLPRPRLFGRIDAAIARVLADPPPGSIAARLTHVPDPVTDLRIALAAGYDTTSHTLAWAGWHLAAHPDWRQPEALPLFLDEVLRCYPAGWLGSRVTSHDTIADGVAIAAGTLVLYSPYLTHHDPGLWPEPHAIRPGRFASGRPAWSYLPFAAGPRACLGTHLARLVLQAALAPLCRGRLVQLGGDPRIATGITLRPRGPLQLHSAFT